MQMQPIKGSTSIAAVGYDPEGEMLTVEFNSGRRCTYIGVPQGIYEGLINASSAGSFFHQQIRDQYQFSG